MTPGSTSRKRASIAIFVGGSILLTFALVAQLALSNISGEYNSLINNRTRALNELSGINQQFKTQVQEWKNVLLRGHESEDRMRYWEAFQSASAQVTQLIHALEKEPLSRETRDELRRFSQAHLRLQIKYETAYQQFLDNPRDPFAVDDSVRGIDRDPANKLTLFTESLEQEIAREAAALAAATNRYLWLAIITLIVSALLVTFGVVVIVRGAIETEVDARTRTDFLAKMSHEIRTPMNGVLGMSELLASTPLNEQQRRYNQAIHSSGQSLLVVINDLLDYSRIESGKMTIEAQPFSLRALLSNLYYLFIQKAAEKNCYWRIDLAPEIPDTWLGDSARLNQILVNLTGNAFKFTREGGVTLQVTFATDGLHIQCKDTGIGMSEEALERVFTPFVQANQSIQSQFGGTGLGLVISRELARQMGGDLTVTSTEGKGSTFNLHLPISPQSDPRIAMPEALQQVLLVVADDWQRSDYERHLHYWQIDSEAWQPTPRDTPKLPDTKADLVLIDLPDHNLSDRVAEAAKAAGKRALQLYDIGQSNEWINSHGQPERGFKDRPPFGALLQPLLLGLFEESPLSQTDPRVLDADRKLHILAADDNAVNRSVVSAMIAKLGHHCVLACDGEDAVTQFLYAGRAFDLILMDCEMPVLDGLGALRCIRELEAEKNLPAVPIVALTANAFQSDRERYLEAGMDQVLTKPISLDRLRTALASYY